MGSGPGEMGKVKFYFLVLEYISIPEIWEQGTVSVWNKNGINEQHMKYTRYENK